MKLLQIGWESDMLHKNSVTVSNPVLNDITVLGYQFDLGMMAWNTPGIWGNETWYEVLFHADFGIKFGDGDFGPGILKDYTGGRQNLHGGGVDYASFCQAILKSSNISNGENAVNKSISLMGLHLLVPKGSTLTMTAGHAGYGPIDFECQGVLFYT